LHEFFSASTMRLSAQQQLAGITCSLGQSFPRQPCGWSCHR
jgi:hypothetical protein